MKKLGLQSQEEVKEERSKFFHWFAQIKPYAILDRKSTRLNSSH